MRRFAALILSLVALAWSVGAAAGVRMSFHSFNGSVLFGRFPHAFVVLEGTLDKTGHPIDENYGFTAKTISTRLLNEPADNLDKFGGAEVLAKDVVRLPDVVKGNGEGGLVV